VTRIYDQELRNADIEISQFGLLTALAFVGEASYRLPPKIRRRRFHAKTVATHYAQVFATG